MRDSFFVGAKTEREISPEETVTRVHATLAHWANTQRVMMMHLSFLLKKKMRRWGMNNYYLLTQRVRRDQERCGIVKLKHFHGYF
jgi:hypothetical protein